MDSNPKLDMEPSFYWMAAGFLFMAAISVYGWIAIPPDTLVPTHWNIHGEVDAYGSKTMGLILIPVLELVFVPLLLLIPRLDPRKDHVAQSGKFLTATIAALTLLFSVIHAAIVLATLGLKVPMGETILTLVGLFFMVLGNYSGKVRRNFFMGVRTPWTLSSELSWNKTHRLVGRLFLFVGAVIAILAWINSLLALGFLIAGIVVIVTVAMVYSHKVWKEDTNAHPSKG